MLELINRARLDPLGEAARFGIDLNEGLAAGTISSAPKAPLAFNVDLNESSAGHSAWMLGADVFSHTGSGGSSSSGRMKAAGYVFSGSWKSGENISWRGTTGTLNTTAMIYEQHKSLFLSEGHRKNTLGDFREIGIAQETGGFTKSGVTYNASMITQNFAKTGTSAFITGVAYSDADKDRFYDVGEGRSGLVIDWLGNAGGAVSTALAGGYAVKIPTGLTGTAAVSVDLGATTVQATLGMTGTNVKLDVVDGRVLAASTHLTLGTGAADGRLLGVENLNLTGNAGGNILEGNGGANLVQGMGGNDSLHGLAGNDVLRGGDGNDRLDGGLGTDRLEGGLGDDLYVLGASGDTVVELAGAGTDQVSAAYSTGLASNVENLVLTGTAAINGSGNGLGNHIQGNGAANLLRGMDGQDQLKGMAGNDILEGGNHDDALTGGAGADRLAGGAGYDDFVFLAASDSRSAARDVITDFTRGVDDIHVWTLDANAGLSGNQAFTLDTNGSFSAGEIKQTVSAGNLYLSFNTDSDSTPEMSILLQGITSPLAASDFIL